MLALICAAIEDPDDREFMTQFYLEYERLMYATARKKSFRSRVNQGYRAGKCAQTHS